ncbi:MAG: ATP-binding protein [Cytophaga sp.]|uniref:ATP-binding protein n=1 Tax=Cytophaga sp. TaxID=29535 RepID=UPI003F7DFF57
MNNKIKISRDPQNLKAVRDFVSTTLQSMSVPDPEINMMVLAVDEVCANRILHNPIGASETFNNNIELEIENDNNNFTFLIRDTGELYDINSHESPDIRKLIAEKRKGGIGLLLVKKIMDSIEISRSEPYTVLLLRKTLKYA